MRDETIECQRCCKGSPPFFGCRNKACICHKIANTLAQETPNRLPHRDKTADIALSRIMKGKRGKA